MANPLALLRSVDYVNVHHILVVQTATIETTLITRPITRRAPSFLGTTVWSVMAHTRKKATQSTRVTRTVRLRYTRGRGLT